MKKRYKFVLIPLAVLTLLLVASALVVDWHGKRTLERSVDAVVADGGFRDFSGFARPELADDQNAATAWLKAAALAWGETGHNRNGELTAEQEALSKPQYADLELLAAAIDARQQAVDKAWEAADRSAVHWPIDYNDPISWIDNEYIGQTRLVGRFLSADARVALSRGDYVRAEQSLLAILALSDDVSVPPALINSMVSISLDALAMNVIEDNDANLSRDLPTLREALSTRPYRSLIADALRGEIPFGLAYMHSNDTEIAYLGRWPVRLWTQYDMANYVEVLHQFGALTEQPYAEAQSSLAALDEPRGFPYVLSGIMLPAGKAAAQTANHVELQRDLLLLSDQIRQTPVSQRIDRWGGERELPVDLLTGHPVRVWLAEDRGIVVWSTAAEASDYGPRRFSLVCQTKTDSLPPELEAYQQEWKDYSPRAQRKVD
ncbi:hypothetical protein [Algisphaera agarilytica]|uniref:Uncharacterized protein n=1 Tax=Algisphaera agarilytica TaxID=1385975 RepID=A0A7X0H909_9BACT|nr:hypothetical protein [Algisphaera agarilytica]MBB6431483.1 hypothetical protein [Algisphaera agarilytica]